MSVVRHINHFNLDTEHYYAIDAVRKLTASYGLTLPGHESACIQPHSELTPYFPVYTVGTDYQCGSFVVVQFEFQHDQGRCIQE